MVEKPETENERETRITRRLVKETVDAVRRYTGESSHPNASVVAIGVLTTTIHQLYYKAMQAHDVRALLQDLEMGE